MKFLKIFYYAAFSFIVLIALLLVFSAIPIPANFQTMVVLSGSMEPAIKLGSIVIVKPASDYKIGDIVTFGPFSKTKPPTTHRVYDIKVIGGQPVYITKGDANNAPDLREIRKSDILGKVLFSVPYLGFAVDFAQKPAGFALIIIVPAAVIISDEVKKIYAEIKKKRENQ